jgi:ABC-type sugar transport system permease subunit
MNKQPRLFMAAMIAPAFILFTFLVAIPCAQALGYAFQKWDGLTEATWVGLSNFRQVLQPGDIFRDAVTHNLFLAAVSGAVIIALALAFAALIHRGIRGATVFRATFFFPNVLASVAVALLWTFLYSPTDVGLLNKLLVQLHLIESNSPVPFTESRYLIWSIVPVLVWTATGFYMVLFLAAMENIPESYYEAAALDGASGLSQFWHVTLPCMREVLVVGIVFLIISSLKTFDILWVMENQWPTRDTHVMATLIYQKTFSEYNVGYGAAVAVLLFILVFAATLVTLRFSRKEALEY